MPRSQAVDPRWAARARRARTLRAERPHAEPLLSFYLSLLELQTPLCDRTDATRWLQAVSAPDTSDLPRLQLERLPLDELSPRFGAFCRGIPETAPEPVARAAQAASAAGGQTQAALLRALLTGSDFQTSAGTLGCDPAPLAFLPRGFLSPLAEAVSALVASPSDSARTPTCPRCGWPPQVSMLDDEPDAQGIRRLVCSLCATAWVFRGPPARRAACRATRDCSFTWPTPRAMFGLRPAGRAVAI